MASFNLHLIWLIFWSKSIMYFDLPPPSRFHLPHSIVIVFAFKLHSNCCSNISLNIHLNVILTVAIKFAIKMGSKTTWSEMFDGNSESILMPMTLQFTKFTRFRKHTTWNSLATPIMGVSWTTFPMNLESLAMIQRLWTVLSLELPRFTTPSILNSLSHEDRYRHLCFEWKLWIKSNLRLIKSS